MKVCFIVEYYPPHVGGGETLFAGLAQGLTERGCGCRVVTCSVPGAPRREMLHGVAVHRVPAPRFLDRLWFPVLGLRTALAQAGKCNLIHTTTYTGALAGWLAGKLLRKPVVLTAHEVLGRKWLGLGLPFFTGLASLMAEKLVLGLPFDAYSCNSKSTMAALVNSGIPKKKAFLAYPSVDYQRFRPGASGPGDARRTRQELGWSPGDFACLAYGRAGLLKGMDVLMAAVPKVLKALPDFKLLMILAPEPSRERKRLAAMAENLPNGVVSMLPSVGPGDIPGYLDAADCVVVPSLSEGFGFCCAEACAMGKPVVASRAGSLPEVVSGKHVLVKPGDPEDMALGILAMARGDCVDAPPKEFPAKSFVEGHLRVYAKLLTQLSGSRFDSG